MALEDIASLRAVLGSVVLYPSDANQAVQLLDAMREHRGISYLRTTREATPVLYEPDETFEIGGSRTVRSGDDDAVTLIGAGITLHECLTAADELAEQGHLRPGHRPLLGQARRRRGDPRRRQRDAGASSPSRTTGSRAGSARSSPPCSPTPAWRTGLARLAVTERPGSGPPAALLSAAGIDAAHIVTAVERVL